METTKKREVEIPLKGLKDFWWRFKKNKTAVLGMGILIIYILMAIFGSYITLHEPGRTGVGPPFIPPGTNLKYPFGTDRLGKDIFSSFVAGAKVSVVVGVTAALGSAVIGIIVGSVSGYMGGRVDDVLMRITDFEELIK